MGEEKWKNYSPTELPTEITRKLYIGYGIGTCNAGRISVSEFESDSEYSATVRIMEQDITFKLPSCKINIGKRMLEILQAEKQKILAENHQRLFAVQEKIDKLLAIDCRPEAQEVREPDVAESFDA